MTKLPDTSFGSYVTIPLVVMGETKDYWHVSSDYSHAKLPKKLARRGSWKHHLFTMRRDVAVFYGIEMGAT